MACQHIFRESDERKWCCAPCQERGPKALHTSPAELGHKLYLGGVRVPYTEAPDYWNHTGMSRRQRRRLAAKLLREGRIDAPTAKFIGR